MEEIYTAYYESPLGAIQIKSTSQAVQSILFISQTGTNDLHLPAVLIECINQLADYFRGERQSFSCAIKQPIGTPFQETVWKKLIDIPFGKTLSYLELAKKIGDEKSVRAVGNANSRNQISIIVPCHRVIGSNKQLVGYAGELWRKKWLLDHEQKVASRQLSLF
jgi:methylated-DNA-[protein]-cysteine S-methyltransferase